MPNEIQVSEFRRVVNTILDNIEAHLPTGVVKLDDNSSLYWDIATDDLCNMEVKPEPDVGSLMDDWSFLKPVLDNPSMGAIQSSTLRRA